nr:unnamed protein product [Digitaria exilis]
MARVGRCKSSPCAGIPFPTRWQRRLLALREGGLACAALHAAPPARRSIILQPVAPHARTHSVALCSVDRPSGLSGDALACDGDSALMGGALSAMHPAFKASINLDLSLSSVSGCACYQLKARHGRPGISSETISARSIDRSRCSVLPFISALDRDCTSFSGRFQTWQQLMIVAERSASHCRHRREDRSESVGRWLWLAAPAPITPACLRACNPSQRPELTAASKITATRKSPEREVQQGRPTPELLIRSVVSSAAGSQGLRRCPAALIDPPKAMHEHW